MSRTIETLKEYYLTCLLLLFAFAQVKAYCEDVSQCRRRMLLSHFDDPTALPSPGPRGERAGGAGFPRCCDNCNFPPRPAPPAGEAAPRAPRGAGGKGR
eukprot:264857-Prorocentrum_minimum.AAC.1